MILCAKNFKLLTKNPWHLPWMEHQFLGRPVGCIVAIPTALLQLHTIINHVTFMVQRRVRA